jgi:integrase
VKNSRDNFRLYVEPLLGDLLVGEIDGRDVAKLLRDLRDTGLSEYSVKRALTMIRALYRHARFRKIVTRSPIDELDPAELPRPKTPKKRRIDERSLDALVRHAEEPYRIGVAILAFTGMRLSEALTLRWRDIASWNSNSTSADK